MNDSAANDGVALALAAWWEANARDLPWRFGRATPWGVLVSEVMSQQTQMSRVVPYWTAWMAKWPDARALAVAPKAEVITAWGRLGYPRRALRLQECAQVVTMRYDGKLPCTYDELVALPGVGDYTASAVLSFAYGRRAAVIDTNIRRVLSRVFRGQESLGGSASPLEREMAWRLLPEDSPRPQPCQRYQASRARSKVASSVMWNQSVMELGALICTAKSPLCSQCPLVERCAFFQAGCPGLGQRRTRPRQRFQGTDRQVRGLVLGALRELDAGETLSRERVEGLWENSAQLASCVASLDDDGLIEILPNGSLRLPQ